MTTKYVSPSLRVIHVTTNDIITSSITTYNHVGNGVQLSPHRRGSIWD